MQWFKMALVIIFFTVLIGALSFYQESHIVVPDTSGIDQEIAQLKSTREAKSEAVIAHAICIDKAQNQFLIFFKIECDEEDQESCDTVTLEIATEYSQYTGDLDTSNPFYKLYEGYQKDLANCD